ncbi:MAG TPA: lactate racemase domain-containing protein [Bacteroidales bacterium]|nr:lactate racemase domain-containing protein [Bacteroidales bacterium]
MIYFKSGDEHTVMSPEEITRGLTLALDKLNTRKKVLIVPPDITRLHSGAGFLSGLIYRYYKKSVSDILPALGTHTPMTEKQISEMYAGIPHELFRVHNWRHDVVTAGIIPGKVVSDITGGLVDYSWPASLNNLILNGGHDLILSVGQVVPHEVIGMANYNKNIFIGTGGSESINKSHFIGAVYGIEKIMGRASNPVRTLLNYASSKFISHLPVIYVLTVIGQDQSGKPGIQGLYIGDDEEAFMEASALSIKVNFTVIPAPLPKVVVYLNPSEYKSTWLGNKSIYRTRMAMADDGELIVIAPGIKEFGEDGEIDKLIRKYGYRGTKKTMHALQENSDLRNNLGAAAHLVHGSTEGRFSVTYCPGHLTQGEIERAGFRYSEPGEMMKKYNPGLLKPGYNKMKNGEEIYYISNPALGLWSTEERIKTR